MIFIQLTKLENEQIVQREMTFEKQVLLLLQLNKLTNLLRQIINNVFFINKSRLKINQKLYEPSAWYHGCLIQCRSKEI
jgi:hypothetical protein